MPCVSLTRMTFKIKETGEIICRPSKKPSSPLEMPTISEMLKELKTEPESTLGQEEKDAIVGPGSNVDEGLEQPEPILDDLNLGLDLSLDLSLDDIQDTIPQENFTVPAVCLCENSDSANHNTVGEGKELETDNVHKKLKRRKKTLKSSKGTCREACSLDKIFTKCCSIANQKRRLGGVDKWPTSFSWIHKLGCNLFGKLKLNLLFTQI